MVELHQEVAKDLKKSGTVENLYEKGEVVEIAGKKGKFQITQIGTRFLTLKALPRDIDPGAVPATSTEEINFLRYRIAKLEEALLWCSGSAEFQEGGQARLGWEKLCRPLVSPPLFHPILKAAEDQQETPFSRTAEALRQTIESIRQEADAANEEYMRTHGQMK
jgi:hypothetical protein